MKKIWKAAALIFAACLLAAGGCGSGEAKETKQNETETEKGREEQESSQEETTRAQSIEETENPAGAAENPSAGQGADGSEKALAAPSTSGALQVNGKSLVVESG